MKSVKISVKYILNNPLYINPMRKVRLMQIYILDMKIKMDESNRYVKNVGKVSRTKT